MVICVDLDGTMIFDDCFAYSITKFRKKHFSNYIKIVFWLLFGIAFCKKQIANRINIDPKIFRYNDKLIDFLKKEKQKGLKLYLATGSDIKYANIIAQHIGIFSGVFASDGKTNLVSHKKAAKLVQTFGEKNFAYAGNSMSDIAVWKKSKIAIAVNTNNKTLETLRGFHENINTNFIN